MHILNDIITKFAKCFEISTISSIDQHVASSKLNKRKISIRKETRTKTKLKLKMISMRLTILFLAFYRRHDITPILPNNENQRKTCNMLATELSSE